MLRPTVDQIVGFLQRTPVAVPLAPSELAELVPWSTTRTTARPCAPRSDATPRALQPGSRMNPVITLGAVDVPPK